MNEKWDDPYDEQEPTPTSVHIGLILIFCAVFLVIFGVTLR